MHSPSNKSGTTNEGNFLFLFFLEKKETIIYFLLVDWLSWIKVNGLFPFSILCLIIKILIKEKKKK